jgi:hypothetical protein
MFGIECTRDCGFSFVLTLVSIENEGPLARDNDKMVIEPESANTTIPMDVDGEHLTQTSFHIGSGVTINLPETSAIPAQGPKSPGGPSIPKDALLERSPEISAPVVQKSWKLTQYFAVATEERAANYRACKGTSVLFLTSPLLSSPPLPSPPLSSPPVHMYIPNTFVPSPGTIPTADNFHTQRSDDFPKVDSPNVVDL